MQHTIAAVFDNRKSAQEAEEDLVASGFSRSDIRVSESEQGQTSQYSADTSSGSTFGSSVRNFFDSIFGTDRSEDARMYADAVARGHIVLTLNTDDQSEIERAADILERYGPLDIEEDDQRFASMAASGAARQGVAGTQQGAQSVSMQSSSGQQSVSGQQATAGSAMQGTAGSQQRATNEATAIPVVQEELKIGKREVARGGVRVYRRVLETPVNESIELREEQVNVERRTVDHPASVDDAGAFEEASFEVRARAEEPVVEKTARVVEEVVVGKTVTTHQQDISDTVRRTEVEVEELGLGSRQGELDDDSYFQSHWTSNYAGAGGSFDDYAPAYRYGSSMAGSPTYKGQKWDTVEPTLRRDWEQRYPGSAWERFKGAIRHGWDRVTS